MPASSNQFYKRSFIIIIDRVKFCTNHVAHNEESNASAQSIQLQYLALRVMHPN